MNTRKKHLDELNALVYPAVASRRSAKAKKRVDKLRRCITDESLPAGTVVMMKDPRYLLDPSKRVVAILHQSFRQTVDDVFPDNAFKILETITSQYEINQSGDTIQAVLTQLHEITKKEDEQMNVYLSRITKLLSTLKTLK